MTTKMITTLENNKGSKYVIYMQGIEKSNLDKTIVRWEARYDHVQNLVFGASVSYGNRIFKLEEFISELLVNGYREIKKAG